MARVARYRTAQEENWKKGVVDIDPQELELSQELRLCVQVCFVVPRPHRYLVSQSIHVVSQVNR
jgi:hypothetical protein